jgi:hypothetical protein
MIVYEVNLTVDADIADEYAAWLDSHIQEILTIDGFTAAEWFDVEAEGEQSHWCVHYYLHDRASLERYFANHAERMRADGLNRFGGRFSASRRILALRQGFGRKS